MKKVDLNFMQIKDERPFLVNNRGRYIFEEKKTKNNGYLQGLKAKFRGTLHLKKSVKYKL